jgi:transposase
MKDLKKVTLIVLIATAFVAGFFSFSIAADKSLADKARTLVRCAEAHLSGLRQRVVLLDIAEEIVVTVRDGQKELALIQQQIRATKKELEKLGLSTPPAIEVVWGEKEERDFLRKIDKIRKEREEVKKLELEAIGMLEEVRTLLREAERENKP